MKGNLQMRADYKKHWIPFINGMQPYHTGVKPIKSNGYQTVFNIRHLCTLPARFEGTPDFFDSNDKLVFTENFTFDDELIISSMYASHSAGCVVLELMSKTGDGKYCAIDKEAHKIVMASNGGTVRGRFTFKYITQSRYRYSLVLLDPFTEHFLAYKDNNTIFFSNYSKDVVQSLFNMLSEKTKEQLYFGTREKI